jgi:hypothetical protein
MGKLLWGSRNGSGSCAVQLRGSLGGDDYNGRRNSTGREGEIHTGPGDGVDNDGRVREQSSKSQTQAVRMGEGIGGEESV